MREAISLGEYVNCEEYTFCRRMADIYGCIPLQTDREIICINFFQRSTITAKCREYGRNEPGD